MRERVSLSGAWSETDSVSCRSCSASHSIPYGRELDNATILSAAADERGNIWLGLDSGAASIDNSTQDYYFTDSRLGQVHGVIGLGDDRMLIGSNKGLFLRDNDGSLNLIPGSTGSVWELDEIGGRIYVLHDLGLFRLAEGLRLTPVVTGSGVYSLRRCRNDRRFYIMSTYSGVSLLRHTDEGLQPVSRIADYSGFTRNIRIDENDNLVVSMEKKEEKNEDKKEGRYLRREFSYSKFQQTMVLPENAEKEKIEAKVENGVLNIIIPKMSEEAAKKAEKIIEIK